MTTTRCARVLLLAAAVGWANGVNVPSSLPKPQEQAPAPGCGTPVKKGGSGNDCVIVNDHDGRDTSGGTQQLVIADGSGGDDIMKAAAHTLEDSIVFFRLYGGDGNDRMYADGSDAYPGGFTLVGEKGNDFMLASHNLKAVEQGGLGDDILFATMNDIVYQEGGPGNDKIMPGKAGTLDLMTGSAGKDIFYLRTVDVASKKMAPWIMDFEKGQDHICLPTGVKFTDLSIRVFPSIHGWGKRPEARISYKGKVKLIVSVDEGTSLRAADFIPCGSATAPTQSSVTPAGQCVQKSGKCGGLGYTGSTKCCAGTTCIYDSKYSSQCRAPAPSPPAASEACMARWSQCGGKGYKGSTKCCDSNYCKVVSMWYSQCTPKPAK